MDLTTLTRCKEYLAITTSAQDALISHLITRSSGQIARWCSARFDRQSFTDKAINGTGGVRLYLPDVPVISVSSVKIEGTSIPASSDGVAAGYQFDDRMLYVFGGTRFFQGFRNILVSYQTGYTASETDVIPTANVPTLTPTAASDNDGSSYAFEDLGVVFSATGIALTPVASAPVAGEYSFSSGTYTFNSADANASVTMSYDYVPGSVEQACIEMVGLKLKQRDNLGIQSRTMANETVVYTDRDMTKSVVGLLYPYNKRIPV